MKKINTIYWIFTGLLSVAILLTAIPSLINSPQAVAFFAMLGYPAYLVAFLDIAKILAVIAILIPGYPRIKEWAYAGIAYDLIGAAYSQIAKRLPVSGLIFMAIFFILLFGSYIYYHKKVKATV